MNVVFLDYDGVINTPCWKHDSSGWHTFLCYPGDGYVNNTQAIQWVSEFCQKHNYGIVVSSTWKRFSNWQECLQTSGLRPGIEIVGRTKNLSNEYNTFVTRGRSEEIATYLFSHPEVERYLIFDDEDIHSVTIESYTFNLKEHLVHCNYFNGFLGTEYFRAQYLHEHYDTIG